MKFRTALILVISLGFLVLLVPVVLLMFITCDGASGCWTFWKCNGNPEIQQVSPPPRNAAPQEIVRAYFQALKGHDKKTARLLWDQKSSQFEAEFSEPGSNFTNWTSLTNVSIGEAEVEDCGDINRCVRIPVSYKFKQCTFYTNADGEWSERFFIDRIDGRWLITGHGQG